VRCIKKGSEPRSLTEHRAAANADFDNLPKRAKDELRRALVTEQGVLCCYCMGRISDNPESMKVEHWTPQSQNPEQQLVYRNLLAACLGGEGRPPSQRHCDTRKGNQIITIDPRAPSHHPGQLRYLDDGTILVNDKTLQDDVDKRLNLNLDKLKSNRKDALRDYLNALKDSFGPERGWSISRLKNEVDRLEQKDRNGAFAPYVEILLYWLRKRLNRG
jgi:uncharacterized protein (TIGR02646 family)